MLLTAVASGLAILLGKVLAFLREAAVAYSFGASHETDVFLTATTLTTVVVPLAASAFGSATVPWLARRQENQGEQKSLSVLAGYALLASAVLTLLGLAATPVISRLMGPESTDALLVSRILFVTLPVTPLLVLQGLIAAWLNVREYFFVPALGGAFMNFGVVLITFAGSGSMGIMAPVWGYVAGALFQFGLTYLLARWAGISLRPSLGPDRTAVIAVLTLMLPVLMNNFTTQAGLVFGRLWSGVVNPGMVSYLNYSGRLVLLPIGILTAALLGVVYPYLSKYAPVDQTLFRSTYLSALKLITIVAAPVVVGLFVLAEPIVQLVYERQAFGPIDTLETALALKFLAPGVLAVLVWELTVKALLATNDRRLCLSLAVTALGLAPVLIGACASLLPRQGLMLGTAASQVVGAALALWAFHRKHGTTGTGHFSFVVKLVLASGVMAAGMSLPLRLLAPPVGALSLLAYITGVGVLSLVLYGAVLKLLGLLTPDLLLSAHPLRDTHSAETA